MTICHSFINIDQFINGYGEWQITICILVILVSALGPNKLNLWIDGTYAEMSKLKM